MIKSKSNDRIKKIRTDPLPTKDKKSKKKKLIVEYNEKARFEYLTGFHKRKVERRQKAKKQEEDLVKEKIFT